jgi:hypothetical protein
MPERLDHSASEDDVEQHRWRYRWAARFTSGADVVLDAACGHGFARPFLNGHWVGVDRLSLCGNLVADLNTWQPDFDFDVFVGLETIEHLQDIESYVAAAKKARRTVVISTPVVPTAHSNEFHLRDFTAQQVIDLFSDGEWGMAATEIQEWVYGIFAFTR